MRRITNLFALLLMSVLGAVGASAEIVPGGHYTIRPYSAPTQYVIPAEGWDTTGGDKATYATEGTMENGGVWLIQTSESGFSFSPANKGFAPGYLNPWDASSKDEGAVGTWKTNSGDDAWKITPVDGYENVYTISNVNTPAVYLYYKADAELFYFNKPGSPDETNYFFIEVVPIQYTVSIVGQEGVTVTYKGQDITSGISTTDVIAAADVEATDIDGYRYSVNVNNGVITVTYMETIDTTKMYYLKNVNAGLYVVLGTSGNATISSTDKTKFRLSETEQGFTIQTTSGSYLGANSWNTRPQTEAFYWKITKVEGGYTFYQNTALVGYMGLDGTTSGSKIYCNKGEANNYVFALEEASEQTSYSVTITGAPEGTTLGYNGANYANGETIATTATITAEDITVNELDGYIHRLNVGDSGIEVAYTYVADRVLDKSDVDENKSYYIYTEARGGITLENAEADNACGTKEVSQSVGPENEMMRFAFINYKDALYLYSVAKGMFLCVGNTFSQMPKDVVTFVDASDYTVRLTLGDKNINLGGSNQLMIDNWKTKDDGNSFIIRPAADFDPSEVLANLQLATITVNYTLEGKEYKTVEKDVRLGETFAPAALPFTNLAVDQAEFEVTENKTISVDLVPALPFTVSDPDKFDFALGLLYVHSNQTRCVFAKQEEDESFSFANDNTQRPEKIDPTFMWYITGNLIDGFKLHNFMLENYGSPGVVTATEEKATFSEEGTAFELCAFNAAENGNFDKLNASDDVVVSKKFTLHCDHDYLNAQGTEFKYWNAADAGSTFVFAVVNDVNLDGVIDLNDVAALAESIAKGQPCLNGNINSDGVTSIADLTELIDMLQPEK